MTMDSDKQENLEMEYYAPVIIPTLCRFDHFKQCIESLSRCIWADKTEVFVGLDYPAKESHWDGYKKIKTYLETASLGFKALHVIKREKNYGFGVNGNSRTLALQALEHHESYIFTEDDNIFSPNFLVYINKGLQKFKDDESVHSINGYRHFYPIKKDRNTFCRESAEFSAWGYGIWKNRFQNLPPCDYFQKNFTLKNFFKIKKKMGNTNALHYWSYYFRPFASWYDCPTGIYAYLEKKDFIIPSETSLVRNIGWDGSGEHCAEGDELAQKHLRQNISTDTDFEYNGTGFEFYEENQKIFRDYSYAKTSTFKFWKKFCKWVIKYILVKLSILKLKSPE